MWLLKTCVLIVGGFLSIATLLAAYKQGTRSPQAEPIVTPTRSIEPTNSVQAKTVQDVLRDEEDDEALNAIQAERESLWRGLVLATKLDELERKKIASSDIEIRVWNLPGLYISETKCWQIVRANDQWSGFAFVSDSNVHPVKKTPLKFNQSAEWNDFVTNRLSPSKIRELSSDSIPENDSLTVVLEVNAGGDYARRVIQNGPFLRSLLKSMRSQFTDPNPLAGPN